MQVPDIADLSDTGVSAETDDFTFTLESMLVSRNSLYAILRIDAKNDDAAAELAARGLRPDAVVVDPPRKGMSAEAVAAVASMYPECVVYVSCDPATLARDLKLLTAAGYTLQTAEAFDLFPRCAHVETVVLLSKGEIDSKKVQIGRASCRERV